MCGGVGGGGGGGGGGYVALGVPPPEKKGSPSPLKPLHVHRCSLYTL